MRFGSQANRRRAIRYALPTVAVTAAAAYFQVLPAAIADVFRFQPSLGIEQIFTDNVRATSDDQDADGITVLEAGLDMVWQTPRINAVADINLFYNEFWASNDLDSFNGSGAAAARTQIIRDLFFIDANVERNEVFLSPQDSSATGLSTGSGTIQRTNWDVAPTLRHHIFNLADAEIRAHYGQVLFDEPIVGVTTPLIEDITAKAVSGRITTGERSSTYELVATAQHFETDLGFEQRNVIGGVILHVTKSLSTIGRYGYERISDPSFPTIRGPIWGTGVIYRPGQNSTMHVEYGSRFGGPNWLGEVNFVLSPRIRMTGAYRDVLIPAQLGMIRSIDDLFDQEGNIDVSVPLSPNTPDPLLLDEIVRQKSSDLTLSYNYGLQTFRLGTRHFERKIPATLEDDKFLVVDFTLEEDLSRRLRYFASIEFQNNYDTPLGSDPSKSYRAELLFQYQIAENYLAQGGYTWQLDTSKSPDEGDTLQNVLRFGLTRSF